MSTTPGNRLDTRTLRGRFRYDDDTAANGDVTFVRTGGVLRDLTEHEFLVPKTIGPINLDNQGEFTVSIPVTDDPDVVPTGWTWTVNPRITGASFPPFTFNLPRSLPSPVWLDALAPAGVVEPSVSYVLSSDPRLSAVPTGGQTGQVLTKISNADYATGWGAGGSGGGGGTAVSTTFTPAGGVAATNVQAAITELDTEKSATAHTHTAQTADTTTFTPTGTIAATTVQAAIAEVDAEKAPIATTVRYFDHGTNTAAVRPAGAAPVYWTGSVDPANRLEDDLWDDPSGVSGAETGVYWNASDWSRFTEMTMTADTLTTFTKTVVEDTTTTGGKVFRGRVANTAGAGGGNTRVWHLLNNTDTVDSEITSLWYSRSDHPSGGQIGHVHRAQVAPSGTYAGRPIGFIVWYDIVTGIDPILNMGLWTTNGLSGGSVGLVQPAGNTNKYLPNAEYQTPILYSSRGLDTAVITVPYGHRIQVGDSISIAGTVNFDTAFSGPRTVTAVPNPWTVNFSSPGTNISTDTTPGIIKSVRRSLPYWVTSRLVGTRLRVKVWRHKTPEPDWADPDAVFTWDDTGTGPTGPGKCGLAVGHLSASKFVEVGSFKATSL